MTDEADLGRLADTWESKYRGEWLFDVADGVFHHDGVEALVFEVIPAKILAFSKGDFAQTRFRVSPRST